MKKGCVMRILNNKKMTFFETYILQYSILIVKPKRLNKLIIIKKVLLTMKHISYLTLTSPSYIKSLI